MKEKKIEDYIHHHLGCEVETPTRRYRPEGGKSYKAVGKIMDIDLVINQVGIHFPEEDIHDLKNYPFDQIKLLLRPLSSMTEEEAKLVLQKLLGTDDIIFLKVNGNWAACIRDEEDDEEFIEDDRDRLNYAEEADHDNVLSIDVHNKSLAYGTDEEMRFFTEMDVQSQYINELRKLHFDCDELIKSGLALDKTLVKN